MNVCDKVFMGLGRQDRERTQYSAIDRVYQRDSDAIVEHEGIAVGETQEKRHIVK